MNSRQADAAYADGDRITERRQGLGLTREELRDRSGVSLSTLGRAEAGRRIRVNILAEIAEALGVAPSEIMLKRKDVRVLSFQSPPAGPALPQHAAEIPFGNGIAGFLPPPPPLMIGRDEALLELKQRLGILGGVTKPRATQVLAAMRGWPGVGKTTLAGAIAHDSDTRLAFPDGVLWTSLGPEPDILSGLTSWGRALGVADVILVKKVQDAASLLATILADKRILLIVDDVWEACHAAVFRLGGPRSALLVTTRQDSVALGLGGSPSNVYKLDVLRAEDGLELLRALAPTVVDQHPQEALDLVRDLEGLPLALQVAGRLLNAEQRMGWGIGTLLEDIRSTTVLLESEAPPTQTDVAEGAPITVAALLHKSTDLLSSQTRACFASLGALAPKPATFDLEAITAIQGGLDAKPLARDLVSRGLLEPVGSGRFQMHALLVAHARSLLSD